MEPACIPPDIWAVCPEDAFCCPDRAAFMAERVWESAPAFIGCCEEASDVFPEPEAPEAFPAWLSEDAAWLPSAPSSVCPGCSGRSPPDFSAVFPESSPAFPSEPSPFPAEASALPPEASL